MTGIQIYNAFLTHYKRLNPEFSTWEKYVSQDVKQREFEKFIKESLQKRLPSKEGSLVLLARDLPELITVLEESQVSYKALEIIKLMENSNTWEEFQEKDKQPEKPPEKELTDFDKILKGMLSVPPPKKDKKGKSKSE